MSRDGQTLTPRAEAERRWPRDWDVEEGTFRDGTVNGFILGAEWARKTVLAEVSEEIRALTEDWWIEDAAALLDVLDRAAGETGDAS